MGQRGPLAKRDEERERRNRTGEDGLETKSYDVLGTVEIPTAFFFNTYVNAMWMALKESVHVKFFEPSDWAYAKFTFKLADDLMGDEDKFKIPSAQMMMVLDGMFSKLMLTEGDRRRAKIEAQRNPQDQKNGKVIDAQNAFRELFEKQRDVS